MLSAPLRGIIPPLLTPLLGPNELDKDGLSRLISRILDGQVNGIFILGTTGEGVSLSYALRKEMIECVCRLVAGRVPVLVNVTDTAFAESIDLAKYAAEKGAAAVVLAPPYFFAADQTAILEWIRFLVPQLPLPCFLYNLPSLTKISLAIDTVLAAMDVPGIVGVKDSSGDMHYHQRLIVACKKKNSKFTVLIGPEELLAESVLFGGDGGISGGANLDPSLFVAAFNAADAKDIIQVQERQKKIIQQSTTLYALGNYSSVAVIGSLKCALHILGVCSDCMAPPFFKFTDNQKAQVRSALVGLGHLSE